MPRRIANIVPTDSIISAVLWGSLVLSIRYAALWQTREAPEDLSPLWTGRGINIHLRFLFLGGARRWIYNGGITLFFFGRRIRDSRFLLLAGCEQGRANQ